MSIMNITVLISVTDIYGSVPIVPSNYEAVDFRATKEGDIFLSKCLVVTDHAGPYLDKTPRLILKLKKPQQRRRWIVEFPGMPRSDQSGIVSATALIVGEVKEV